MSYAPHRVRPVPEYSANIADDPRGPIDWQKAYEELAAYDDTSLPIHALKEGQLSYYWLSQQSTSDVDMGGCGFGDACGMLHCDTISSATFATDWLVLIATYPM
jgi:hypothetical protein